MTTVSSTLYTSLILNQIYTIFLFIGHNISESIQTQLQDCTFIARDMTAVNGLTSIWYTHSGSILMATENSTCLRDLLVSNDACDKTFQSVIGLTSPYLNDDKWYKCSIQLNQLVYEQSCLEGMCVCI